jgi:tetratricopeptide (TPR) repeat protein
MSTVTISLPEALAKAAAAQEAGQFVAAERLCRAILGAEPDHFQATLLLAIVQHRRGRLVAAVESYNRTLALRPDCSEALNNRGLALHELNRFADALASYDTALAIRPDDAEVLNNRGVTLDEMGCLEQALASYDKAVAIQPYYATALNNRGNTLQKLKRLDEAVASYDRALAVQPDHVAALVHRGQVLQALARFEEALASYDTALAIRPDLAEAHSGRGYIFQAQERYEDALLSLDRALATRPDWIAVLHNRGLVLQALGHVDEALSSYDRALSLRPDYADALCDRGLALQALNRLNEALSSFDEALALRPDFIEAHSNRGNLLIDLHRPKAALASYERALAIQPDFTAARWGRSMCLLLLGDLDRGWREYESRWSAFSPRVLSQPLWLGDADISGRTILLHSEQGIGDTIQFCRYAKLVARQGARVVLEVQREVATLLTSLDSSFCIIAHGDAVPEFNFHTPMLSLPFAFKTTLDTIPAETVYLHAPEQKLELWRDRLGPRAKPRVGLVWAGNPRKQRPIANRLDGMRSIAFDRLAPLFDATDCEFYSLQKGTDAVAQLHQSAWRRRVVDWTDDLDDFADTAALVENLDLVITVDTSVAHLAGALGKPLWLMNRFNTCWRWLLDRPDSPWYPTARIFRQPRYGDWTSVIESVAAALRLWRVADTAARQAPMRRPLGV